MSRSTYSRSSILLMGVVSVAAGLLFGATNAYGQLRSTNFGTAVAVAAGEVLIGEPNNSYRPGAVYVFGESDEGTWIERSRLTASDAAFYDGFGRSLSVSGNRLVVGAPRQGNGAAYVFERRDGSWVETARLHLPDAVPAEKLGSAVSIEGDLIAIGAPATTKYGRLTPSTLPGSVYVFRWDAEAREWNLETSLHGKSAEIGAAFGNAVIVNDGRIFIGASQQDGMTGAVYEFSYEDGVWSETQMLTSKLMTDRAGFGSSIAVGEGMLFVGAPRHAQAGAVGVFKRDATNGSWSGERLLRARDGGSSAYFGGSLALAGRRMLVGAPTADGARGSAFVFDLSEIETSVQRAIEVETSEDPQTAPDIATELVAAYPQHQIDATAFERGAYFGYGVALEESLAVAAVPQGEGLEGVAAVLVPGVGGRWEVRGILRGDESGLEPVTGGREICVDGKAGLFDCSRIDLLSFLPVKSLGGGRGTQMNDVWGWTDPESDREFVIVGRTDGTSFVEITDPLNPTYLGDLPLTSGARPTVWRDMKVYAEHVFIVADGTPNHGMQVFDLRRLRDVTNPPVQFREMSLYEGIQNAHNVAINEETGYAYLVGSDQCGGGLHMVDVRNPLEPAFAGCFTHTEAGGGSTHDTQCVIYRGPDRDYQDREICLSSNGSAFSIADVTDKKQPRAITSTSFPNYAYVHQGWLTEDHRYFFMNDELDEYVGNVDQTRTLIWDVTDLDDPQLVKEYFFGSTSADHNLYISGDLMYQSNYLSGLHVHDVSDPQNPVPLGHFDTVPVGENSARLDGSWSNYPYFESGVVPVTSKEEGLFMLRVSRDTGL